jgi:hypothetical protein
MLGLFAKFFFFKKMILLHNIQFLAHHNKIMWPKEKTVHLDMVRSMISNFNVPLSLWCKALMTVMYILNRVS